jgi:hypothetical protein
MKNIGATKCDHPDHFRSIKHILVRWPNGQFCVIGGRTVQELLFAVDEWDDPSTAEYLKLPATVSYAVDCFWPQVKLKSKLIHGRHDKKAKWLSWDELIDKLETKKSYYKGMGEKLRRHRI